MIDRLESVQAPYLSTIIVGLASVNIIVKNLRERRFLAVPPSFMPIIKEIFDI